MSRPTNPSLLEMQHTQLPGAVAKLNPTWEQAGRAFTQAGILVSPQTVRNHWPHDVDIERKKSRAQQSSGISFINAAVHDCQLSEMLRSPSNFCNRAFPSSY